eukprot:GFUD01011193.1.p1 GENE.GFUD01011193.1~~GFUD01011193.1.p1  ORF type:complete len:109 (+),score=33.61 GFUD01011193.1:40-366(+)
MQDLPGCTTNNCHPEQQAGPETNATVVEQTQTKVTENDTTNGNVKEKAPPKKKRANPVYITPVRRERKRSCSDSDNEDGDGDGDWAPGKKSKAGKKKAKSRKAKSPKL